MPGRGAESTVLMIGAGFSQRPAIVRMRRAGARVVAVDADPTAPGFAVADVSAVCDFDRIPQIVRIGRRHRVGGVLTVASDRAVPVVAAVADALGLPGIGVDTARVMTNKIAMRERLAARGVPQPRFAAIRNGSLAAAAASVSYPAVLKAADSGGQRGLFKVDGPAELRRRLPETLAVSRSQEAIVEEFHEGRELNAMVVVRRGEPLVLTLSDRLRPPGDGFGVGWAHLYPANLSAEERRAAERAAADAALACGLRDGIAFPQLLVCSDGRVRVVEIGARIGAGQMADLVRHTIGVDLVAVALAQALGREVGDELVAKRFEQPLAIRFLTAAPGTLPAGTVRAVRGLERVRGAPGVVQSELYLALGETIMPVRLDIDRRGYVVAVGPSAREALARADAAARLLEVEVD